MEKIYIIGAKGNLGINICNQLKEFDLKLIEVEDSLDEALLSENKDQSVIALIATPPETHQGLIERLLPYKNVKHILCEKPLPVTAKQILGLSKENQAKIKIIDHYLYKTQIQNIKDFIDGNDNVHKIDMTLCESAAESRSWMYKKCTFGGVTYDLTHHLLAILGVVFGFSALNKIKSLEIQVSEGFDATGDSADRHTIVSFMLAGVLIRCEVGKGCNANKKEVVLYNSEDSIIAQYDLSDRVDYAEILKSLDGESGLLSLEDAEVVNTILAQIVSKSGVAKYIANLKEISKENAIGILQDLTENFKHRHHFYWSSYYKLLIYHMSFIGLPAFLYYNVSQIEFFNSRNYLIEGLCFTLSFSILLLIHFYFLKRTEKYLRDEDHRLKLVIEAARQIYYSVYGLNFYPDKKQALGCDEVISNIISDAGLGGTYMFTLFKHICYVAAVTSVFIFAAIFLDGLLRSF